MRPSRQHRGEEQGLPQGGSVSDAWCRSGMGVWPLCPASQHAWILSHILAQPCPSWHLGDAGWGRGCSPGPPPHSAILPVDWCGVGLAAYGGDSESLPAGREVQGRAQCEACNVFWLSSLGSKKLGLRCKNCPGSGLHQPPAHRDAGRHLLSWSRRLSHRLTVILVEKFQPADAGAGSRARCAVLRTRGMLQTLFSTSGAGGRLC